MPPPAAAVRSLGLSLLLVALATGCSDKADKSKPAEPTKETRHGLTREQADEALVVIGDTKITVGEFAEQLADKSPYLRARYASPERRRELLDELVNFELLAREASRRGLDKSEEVQRTKRQLMVQQMMKAEFEDRVKLSDITDAEIQAYYEAHPDEFHKPAQVRASQIVIRDEAKAKKLLKQLLEQPENETLFRELAGTHNEDPALRARQGDLQFFSRPSERKAGDPELPDAVAEAAFKLEKIGELSPQLVRTEQGFHIVRLTGRRKELARTLDQTRRPIQHRLWRERREAAVSAFVTSLREKAKVEEHWELLGQVKVGLPEVDAGATSTLPAGRREERVQPAGRPQGRVQKEPR